MRWGAGPSATTSAGSADAWLIPASCSVSAHRRQPISAWRRTYRFKRNPIYLGMFQGQVGLAITFNTLWLRMTLVPLALVIRNGVAAWFWVRRLDRGNDGGGQLSATGSEGRFVNRLDRRDHPIL